MCQNQLESTSVTSSSQNTDCDARGKALVHVLAFVLERMVESNPASSSPPKSAIEMQSDPITKFHALRPPSIGIRDYLLRIFKYANCSPECFVLALIYIDRLIQRNSLKLNQFNVHRVLITSVVLAAKFFDDQYFNNAYYAKVGGVPCNEMNSLEIEFLFLTNFSLHVTPEVYTRYYNELANHVAFSKVFQSFLPVVSKTSAGGYVNCVVHFVGKSPGNSDELMYYTKNDVSRHNSDGTPSYKVEFKDLTKYSSSEQKRATMILGVNA